MPFWATAKDAGCCDRTVEKNRHTEWVDSFKEYEAVEEEKVIRPELHPATDSLSMGEVVRAVSEATRHEAILVTDVGQNQMISARYFKYTRERSIVTSGGLGTMGFGLPAAIGATFGRPDRIVCVFMGDGGLQMNIQELGTIMEQKAPVKIICLNNNYLGNVRQWQAMFFNRRYSFYSDAESGLHENRFRLRYSFQTCLFHGKN